MNYQIKACSICGKEIQPHSGHEKYCSECRVIVLQRQAHEKAVRHHTNHAEEEKAWHARRYAAHCEEAKARTRERYVTCKDVILETARKWRRKNPEKVREEYRRTMAHRRSLKFVPLNAPFDGCEGHHIDKERIIYIPARLHESVPHNVFTGKNMEKINTLALDFVIAQQATILSMEACYGSR